MLLHKLREPPNVDALRLAANDLRHLARGERLQLQPHRQRPRESALLVRHPTGGRWSGCGPSRRRTGRRAARRTSRRTAWRTRVIFVPLGGIDRLTEKRRVVCVFRPQSLVVGLRGEPPIIDAPLRGRVKVEECVWQLQDSHRLVLQMRKVAPTSTRAQGGTVDACWWPSLLQGEPDIDVDACKAGCAADLFGNSGHRLRLQKIEVPKAEGEAKYDPVKAEKAWRDFKEHFPDYEMYELNFGKEAGDERKPEEKLVDALQKQAAKDAGEWEASTAES